MLSYIVGLVAALIFIANPLSQILLSYRSGPKLAPRPALDESLLAIDGPNATAPACAPDGYRARILRREPLVVYLEGFLSEDERRHLLEISEPLFEPSTITHDGDATHRDATIRDSHVALVPRSDPVRCIESRALAFQGWRPELWIERLRTQRYTPGGHYSHHFDWSANAGGWGRVSSFMAWVDASADLEGGGTEFPLVERPEAEQWCRFVECERKTTTTTAAAVNSENRVESQGGEVLVDEDGVVFRPVPGNAVYWENFAADGRGYEETWHAGLPVGKGVKVGLNIWSFGRIY